MNATIPNGPCQGMRSGNKRVWAFVAAGLAMVAASGCKTSCDEGQTPANDGNWGTAACRDTEGASSGAESDSEAGATTDMGPPCGDGAIEGDEECDGKNLMGASCTSLGKLMGPLLCDKATCEFNTSQCTCGDNIRDEHEDCDDSDLGGESCAGLGLGAGVLACDSMCKFDESGCGGATCGNGSVEMGEDCDCGMSGGSCPSAMNCIGLPAPNGLYHGGALSCTAAPTCDFDTTQCEYCGDGIINGPDVCDTADLGGATCLAQGYQNGMPMCATDCGSVDYSGCTNPICGDGNVLTPEACDDGNKADGDGCAGDCMHEERWVFVSSKEYQGDLGKAMNEPGGLALADARCQELADVAIPKLPGTYKAWLSDGTGAPSTRFDTGFAGHYRLVASPYPVVATGWKGLTGEVLKHAIDVDEQGVEVESAVWTNTTVVGEKASDLHCVGWTSKVLNMGNTTTVGTTSEADANWTVALLGQSCNDKRRLYCFQNSL